MVFNHHVQLSFVYMDNLEVIEVQTPVSNIFYFLCPDIDPEWSQKPEIWMGKPWTRDFLFYFLDLISEWPVQNTDCCHNVFLGGALVELHTIVKKIKLLYFSLEMESFILIFLFLFPFLAFLSPRDLYVNIHTSRTGTTPVSYTNRSNFITLQKRLLSKYWGLSALVFVDLVFLNRLASRSLSYCLAYLEMSCVFLVAEGTCPSSYQWKQSLSPLTNSLYKVAGNCFNYLSLYQKQTNKPTHILYTSSIKFSLVAQSCLTLCDPMDCSTPGFPFISNSQSLLKLMSIGVSDAIQPSHPLSFPLLLPSIFNFIPT